MAVHPADTPSPAASPGGESARPNWETRPLSDLIRHIVECHHAWLRAELPEIGRLIRREIELAGRERSAQLIQMEKLFRQFQREIEDHLKKEEAVLFPLIERLEESRAAGRPIPRQSFGSLRNPVQFMMQDHELADRLLVKMKERCGESEAGEGVGGTGQAVLERLEAVEADLAAHVQLEDEILFPRAIRLEESGRPADV
jgi:regulator of cell morphogenesis and NO signaling